MTILIKGMEMPENCIYCPVVDDEYGGCLIDDKSHGDPNKPIDCPLIEVPTPHGRLADADALKERIAATYYSQDEKDKAPMDDIPWMNGCNTKVKEVCGMIDDAPTVIEAEEDEEC